ncbi:unnamed protein product [Cunninghamella echinulata]
MNNIKNIQTKLIIRFFIRQKYASFNNLTRPLCINQLLHQSHDKTNQQRHVHILKTPKGTRDYNDKEMAIRDNMFSTIKQIFNVMEGLLLIHL